MTAGGPQRRPLCSQVHQGETKVNLGTMSAARVVAPLCDIGVNLTDPVFRGIYRGRRKHEDDLPGVLERARNAGVAAMLVTGGNLEESAAALELVAAHEGCYSTVGVHPTRCGEFEAHPEGAEAYMGALADLIRRGAGKVVAVGECGLDYDRTQFCAPDVQRKHFVAQFQLAEDTKLPMFLHNRNTDGDFVRTSGHCSRRLAVLLSQLASLPSPPPHPTPPPPPPPPAPSALFRAYPFQSC